MKQFRLLVRAMTKSQSLPKSERKKDKVGYTVFGGFAMFFVMIPCCFIVGLVAYTMTQALMENGGNEQGMLFILEFMSLCSMMFGFHVLLDQLYFTSDLEHLLALPVEPVTIAAAKFYTVYLAESVMEMLVLLSGFAGFLAANHFSVTAILFSLIGVVTLPILPLAYCGIIVFVLMSILKRVGNRKHVSRVILIATLLLMLGLLLSFTGLKGISVENYISILLNGDNIFLKIMNGVFFTCNLMMQAVCTESVGMLLIYLLASAAAVAVFLLLAKALYRKSLQRIRSAGVKEKTRKKIRVLKKHSPLLSCIQKENRVLLRTQAFFSNCIAVNLLWPGIFVVLVILHRGNGFLDQFTKVYHSGRILSDVIMLVLVVGVAMLVTGANSIASSAFTREGAHLEFMKYIPVSYRTQIFAKAVISIGYSFLSSWIMLFLMDFVFQFGAFRMIYFTLAMFFSVVFITFLGIWLDSVKPKLIWEDELNALRGNLNVFFNMALAIGAAAVLCGIGFLLYLIPTLETITIYMIFLLLLLGAAVFMTMFGMKNACRNLAGLLDED